MIERGDLAVVHEPLSVAYYRVKRPDIPHLDEEGAPRTYEEARETLLEKASERPVLFKEMAYHGGARLLDDVDLLQRMTHGFLIRDPALSIASHFAIDPEIELEEVGLEALWRLYERVCELAGCERSRSRHPYSTPRRWRNAPAEHLDLFCRASRPRAAARSAPLAAGRAAGVALLGSLAQRGRGQPRHPRAHHRVRGDRGEHSAAAGTIRAPPAVLRAAARHRASDVCRRPEQPQDGHRRVFALSLTVLPERFNADESFDPSRSEGACQERSFLRHGEAAVGRRGHRVKVRVAAWLTALSRLRRHL